MGGIYVHVLIQTGQEMKARGEGVVQGELVPFFYEVCDRKQKLILAIQIIGSDWASNDCCGVCICCKNIWILVRVCSG